MKRIILYRYHHKFESNKEHLKFIKYLNPSVDIYGLYGGPKEQYAEATVFFKDLFSHNYLINGKDDNWKWKHSDMAFQLWYNDFGHTIEFDIMHVLEWDLLLLDSLENLFSHTNTNTLALTGLMPLSKIENDWYWVWKDPGRSEWLQLLEYFKKEFNYNEKPYGMLGPATTLPRIFLEKIKNIEIPILAHDELRIPMYAQVFGLNMVDTGFYKKWFSPREWRYFNSNSRDISIKNIEKQLKKRNGRRAFHPFRDEISFERFVELYKLIPVSKRSNLWGLFR